MKINSNTSKDLEEPLQKPAAGAVVGKQFCLEKAAQFKLENEVMGKGWTVTDSDGALVLRVQGKSFNCYKPKREVVDPAGHVVVRMEQKVCPFNPRGHMCSCMNTFTPSEPFADYQYLTILCD